jgi:hypothetical protein
LIFSLSNILVKDLANNHNIPSRGFFLKQLQQPPPPPPSPSPEYVARVEASEAREIECCCIASELDDTDASERDDTNDVLLS